MRSHQGVLPDVSSDRCSILSSITPPRGKRGHALAPLSHFHFSRHHLSHSEILTPYRASRLSGVGASVHTAHTAVARGERFYLALEIQTSLRYCETKLIGVDCSSFGPAVVSHNPTCQTTATTTSIPETVRPLHRAPSSPPTVLLLSLIHI